jgi:hypothetical protein
MTITVAVQSKVRTVFDRLDTGIVGSNSTRSVDLSPHLFSVLCCSVNPEALRWVHPPSLYSYYISKGFILPEANGKSERARETSP